MHNQHPQEHPEAPQPKPSTDHKDRSHEGLLSILGTIALLVAAPLIAIVFTMFVFQSYEVDGPSMQNTLQHQDRLIVYKLPKTISRITKKPYIPKRGEIIVFERADLGSSDEFGHGGGKQLIKRVIALPGERVVVKDGQMIVYNQDHPEGFNPDAGTSYANNIANTPGDVDITVPENEVFVAGDNRNNSLDSRYFGTVPSSELVGELVFRLWPSSKSF